MCGIVGILSKERVLYETVARMRDSLVHRGPDDAGIVSLAGSRLCMGHRRLSIIDLSDNAHQPMQSRTDAHWLVYNGEIYNFRELREELLWQYPFASQSDTEVILAAYGTWGEYSFRRFNGMFALAIWDERRRQLILARDRYGIKPLYYRLDANRLLFSSEIRSLIAGSTVEVDPLALDQYFTFQNVLDDRTLFRGVKMLPPGCTMTVDLQLKVETERYWTPRFRSAQMQRMDAVDETRRLFSTAVHRQLVSDVPVASYLSGGMDTGSIATLAKSHLPKMRTHTCGFDLSTASGLELFFDERAPARELAKRIGSEHHEMVLGAGDMEAVMPDVIRSLEDLRVGQCYPNYCLARETAGFNKVALSGTGGDELFAGYPWRYLAAKANGKSRSGFLAGYYACWQRLVPDNEKIDLFQPGTAAAIPACNSYDAFEALVPAGDSLGASLAFELRTFLHGLLVVEDKVSMAHALEVRVPFLDNDLVDFALTIPPEYNLCGNTGKTVLRDAMRGILPEEVLWRRKQGFSAPDGSWFKGPSMDYVKRLLCGDARVYAYLRPEYIRRRLELHFTGQSNQRLFIWSLLSFEWWLRIFKP